MIIDPLLLPPEAAAEMRVSERTLRRMKAQRMIRWVQVSARIWGMRLSDITAYHASRQQGGEGPMIRPKNVKAKSSPRNGNVVSFSAQQVRR